MSSIRETRDRIDSVKSTMKITNAMYMISSTKLNNAKRALAATEPYFYALQSMLGRVVRHLPDDFSHPFIENRVSEKGQNLRRAIICVTADKGLAGAYNHNVVKMTEEHLRKDSDDMLFVIGEFGRHYFEGRKIAVDGEFRYTAQKPTLSRSRQIASKMLELFINHEVDEVYLTYTRMKNSVEFVPEVIQLLPLVRLNGAIFQGIGSIQQEDFALEPNPQVLLDNIVPDFVSGYIYSALVESYASEHSARMQAMDAANKAGQKLVQDLSVQYNRQRQGQITQEITEIAAGAKARARQQERAKESARKRLREKQAAETA
jgi:F-type H+-transporting ATPase subunit gamma